MVVRLEHKARTLLLAHCLLQSVVVLVVLLLEVLEVLVVEAVVVTSLVTLEV